MDNEILQRQYDQIYSFFKTTTDPFDSLEWDGMILEVWHNDEIVEVYSYKDLENIIFNA
jgi:hypothetical protein